MAYTTNPRMPRLRRDAVLFAERHGIRAAARHFGFSPGAVSVWKKKMGRRGYGPIPTRSSRPRSHPRRLAPEVEWAIFRKRLEIRRSAEVVHLELCRNGIAVSLASVKRTLDRMGLTKKRSPWKRRHISIARPLVQKPGDLVQVDTIHLVRPDGSRLYVFTLLDVHSRFAHARAYERANTRTGARFVRHAAQVAPFRFRTLQSDNGPEFSTHFTERVGVDHRHSRVRRPNDNAHLERFNRTIQEECLDGLPLSVRRINRVLLGYLAHYNTTRPHFGLGLKHPIFIHCVHKLLIRKRAP